MKKTSKNLIILTGGGSGGPVAPLLALVPHLKKAFTKPEFFFIGTKGGVEQHMVKKAEIPFVSIASAKLRRYLSLSNILVPFKLLIGIIQAYRILRALNPLCVIGAGGFVQVPVAFAAWLLSVPVFIHQQDVQAGLANRLCAPLARRITVTFPESISDFPHGWSLRDLHAREKVVCTGNPVRELKAITQEKAVAHFRLDSDYPTVLIMGGGTGALSLNTLIAQSVPLLTRYFNVIHITGKGKRVDHHRHARYVAHEFIDEMELCYAAADMVLCRAGLSTITELAALKKPAILVALPGTHQEINALYLSHKQAVLALDQNLLTPDILATYLRNTLFDHALLKSLGRHLHDLMPQDAGEKVAEVIAKALEVK